MKKSLLLSAIALTTSLIATSQVLDDVIMHINGKPVYKKEFEYSYNKNNNVENSVEKKSIDEYVDMFINYKLKVEAAEKMHLDTLKSFQDEFASYRDIQLMPFFVDSAFIDSTALSIYNKTKEQLGGKELLRPAHIFLRLSASASETDKRNTKERIDSIYNELLKGNDFSEIAKKYSQDYGSARNGGLLPWIGPGSTLKEFETVAYSLKTGEMSKPFLSPVGFHIILMKDRKQLETYEQLKPEIYAMLNQQGIAEQASESEIKKIQLATHQDRETILVNKMKEKVKTNLNLKYLIQEYHDGLLLYEASKQKVWDVASHDSSAVEKFFKANKKKYKWSEPRFKGVLFLAKKEELVEKVKNFIEKNKKKDWRKLAQQEFNTDSTKNVVFGLPGVFKKGDNAFVDELFFKTGKANVQKDYPYPGIYGIKLAQPKTIDDVRALVVNDYQDLLEKKWIEQLRKEIPFSVDKNVLQTIKQ